jgi:hypothetical protein
MATGVKPQLIERLCPDCKVSHWQKVVDIYETGDKECLKEAQGKLRAAVKALKKTQEVK